MKKALSLVWGLFLLACASPAYAQLDELQGRVISAIESGGVEQVTENQWYLMYSRGRAAYAYQDGSGAMKHSDTCPAAGATATDCAGYLVRFVATGTGGTYYLQTGQGGYFGSLSSGAALTTTETSSTAWYVGTIGDNAGNFYLYTASEDVRLDASGSSTDLIGWSAGSDDGELSSNRNWALYAVTLADISSLTGEEYLDYQLNQGNLFRLINKAYGRVASVNDAGNVVPAERDDTDYAQVWIIEAAGEGYTLRNASSGKYVQPQNTLYQAYPTALASATLYISPSPQNSADGGDNYFSISHDAAASGRTCLHDDTYGKIVPWVAAADPSAWTIEPVTDITPDEVKAHLSPEPTDGEYYMILNNVYLTALTETDGSLTCAAAEEGDLSQVWKLVADSENGGYKLQNMRSGRFVQKQDGTLSTQYVTGEDGDDVAFAFAESTTLAGHACTTVWTIGDGTSGNYSVGLHCASNLNYKVVGWYTANATASGWVLCKVELTESELGQAYFLQDYPEGGVYRIRNRELRTLSTDAVPLLTETESHAVNVTDKNTGDAAYSQLWILEPSGNGYTLRNAHTGRYVPANPSNGTSSDPATYYVKYSSNNGTDAPKQYVTFSGTADFSGQNSLHFSGDGVSVISWGPGSNGGNTASDWIIEEVEDFTVEAVKTHLSEVLGHYRPETGTTASGPYFRIVNNERGPILYENIQAANTRCKAVDETDYYQLWTLEEDEANAGHYAIRNAVTGRYVQPQTVSEGSSAWSERSTQYATAEEPGYFAFNATDEKWIYNYTIADIVKLSTGEIGLHCDGSSKVVSWNTVDSSPSVWHVEKVEVDAAALAEARAAYETSIDLTDNAGDYNALLTTFFTDYTCSELNETYSGKTADELVAAMEEAGLPAVIRDLAVKVRNGAWEEYEEGWSKTEKTFRVASYKPYSDYQEWAGIIKTGYCFGRLSNPTGIRAKAGDLVTVYVDVPGGETGEDFPAAGTQLALEVVSGTSATGTQTTLARGVNTILCSEDVTLYVFYDVTDTSKELADLPEVKVHIEGGTVNGYFDLTKGDTDEDWAKMQQHLLAGSVVNLKTDRLVFCMNREKVVAACPEKMAELLGIWDNIVGLQRGLMGLEDYASRFNCILNAYSITSSYMYATNYGTYYEESTLASVMNYENMRSTGAIWGPAHENGHIHQQLLNMIGCTEISNNVFSNVAVYEQGYLTSRTDAPATTLGHFNNGDFWLDHGTWGCTRLYWQLYLYYHVQGHNPDFYPNLFKALRSEPMNHSANTPVPASEDYLRFALKCCEVAGEDLSELFEAYGFFVKPSDMTVEKDGVMCKLVDDYANYYLYVTDDMIAEAKAAMKACGKANGNILFIDDRIEPTATPEGEERQKFDGGAIDFANQEYGEMGQYTDFSADQASTEAFHYSVSDDGEVTVAGDGAVGIKVYDADGNLAFLSNTATFTLPEALVSAGFTVKAALADGTDAEADAVEKVYSLKVYEGNATGRPKYSAGVSDLPLLSGNAVAVLQETGAPSALTGAPNVISLKEGDAYEAASLVIADKQDFYAPCAFTARSVTYDRAATYPYNSVCLPFAVSAADFGEGCSLYTLAGFTDNGNGTFVVSFEEAEAVGAGEPCLVKCPADMNGWAVRLTDAEIAAAGEPVAGASARTAGGTLTMKGSFVGGPIGAGKYKLNSSGTRFGVTTDAGLVTAFRSYMEAEGVAVVSTLAAEFGGGTATAIDGQPLLAPANGNMDAVYDLQGRRVTGPLGGGVYIVNGKKVILKQYKTH